jgi:acylphosphatase
LSAIASVSKGFRITGRVQGVFYRAWAQATAEELGLRGSVRNRLDGSVEAQVSGSPETVVAFQERLWVGPPASSVDGVEEVAAAPSVPEGPFRILPTA